MANDLPWWATALGATAVAVGTAFQGVVRRRNGKNSNPQKAPDVQTEALNAIAGHIEAAAKERETIRRAAVDTQRGVDRLDDRIVEVLDTQRQLVRDIESLRAILINLRDAKVRDAQDRADPEK